MRPGPVIPIEHWTQANGVQVYLVQSHSLPMVDVQIDFDAGARRDPVNKAGLASVTAAMASRGLRASANGPALDENGVSEAWADLGASFGGSASSDRMGFSLRSLTYPDLLGKVVELAARQLGEPAFPAGQLGTRARAADRVDQGVGNATGDHCRQGVRQRGLW
jgi:zinc protease